MREEHVQGRASYKEQDDSEHNVCGAPRRDIQQPQEDQEVEQRGAQVALHDHDRQGDAPHREHRQQVRQRRHGERAHAGAAGRQQGAVLGEVAGQDHLEQLGGLAGERPDVQRQARPADHAAEHEHEQQQCDAGRGPGVLVAPQPAVAAHEYGDGRQHGETQDQPHELQRRQPQLDAGDRLGDGVLWQPVHDEQ